VNTAMDCFMRRLLRK